MNWEEIFTEYYSIFRGQGTDIPDSGDPEYALAIALGNNAIRKWARTDGVLWRELFTTALEDGSGDLSVSASTVLYDAPTNMQKPPGKIRFYSTGGYRDIPVIPPERVSQMSDDQSYVWFSGSANTGFAMNMPEGLAANIAGYSINYPYLKQPTMLSTTRDPARTVPDMSDPNFMIHEMLSSRFAIARNSFGYKISKAESTAALANMKINNDTGTFDSPTFLDGNGWGVAADNGLDIKL